MPLSLSSLVGKTVRNKSLLVHVLSSRLALCMRALEILISSTFGSSITSRTTKVAVETPGLVNPIGLVNYIELVNAVACCTRASFLLKLL